ncbi:lactosylceramide 4-alpha-galactosyltransferase-like [Metopolophium dirhodum]|uniref:lactosylceramide 4-alpha-galactosyltransferase-like n=1 Tax=Metopolophium dirhodum TaxID=44670 RepID=UPI002990276C|nr:lactosylceramide 4-alpha-galactosyltransferase-like [Metopolophium dirhodum]
MLCWPYLKRNIIFRIIFLLLISLVIVYNLNFLSSIDQFLNSSQKHLISCYFEEKHDNSLLELNPEEVTKNSIFFVETSCNHKKGINLSLRQGCAIESAANLNPNLNIFVLFVAPSFISDESEIINRFKIYSNVNLRYINFVKYSHNTPLQDFVASNTIATSQWPVSHASDLLRFLTLWKFGGTYLDLDVVLMKSLEGLSNFASIESNTSVASLVLNFDVDKIGRTVSNTSISDFASNYYANDWGYNGPGVITRTLEKICNTNLVTDMNKQKCQGFMVFGTEAFCPIGWTDWRLYFNTNTSDEVMVKLKDSIGIHVWNLHSKHTAINIGSKQPYGLVAEKYCPVIFSMAKSVF